MIRYALPQSGAAEQQLWKNAQRLDTGELFSLGVKHTFERETALGLAAEEGKIELAEREEGTFDSEYGYQMDDPTVGFGPGRFNSEHRFAMSEEDWRASEWYREREDGSAAIKYQGNMTPTRARILAETYDRRRNEEMLMGVSADSVGRKALLFGASFVASLPDPINFIPLAGSLGKGASIGKKALTGAFEGAAGAMLADAIIYPVANERGEDFSFMDAALDATFGAVIGGGLAFGGAKFSKWRDSRLLDKELSALEGEVKSALIDSGLGADEAARRAGELKRSLAEMPDALDDVHRIRRSVGGDERAMLGLAMEKALADVADGNAADVRLELDAVRRASGAWLDTAPLVEAGRPLFDRNMDFAEMIPLARAAYMGLVEAGPVQSAGGEVNFVKGSWRKVRDSISPDKLRLVPFLDEIIRIAEWGAWRKLKRPEHARQGMKVYPLRAVVRLEGRDLDVRLTVREDVNGKIFYDLAELGDMGDNTPPPGSRGPSAEERRATGGDGERQELLPGAEQRQTALRSSVDRSSDINISADADNVNLELRDVTPDMSPPRAEPVYRAAEPPQNLADEMRAQGIDPKTGQSLDELDVSRLEAEGRVTAEERAALEAARADNERADLREDIALGLVGCIIGAV